MILRFVRGSDSISQVIQHSVEFQRCFKEHVVQNNVGMKTAVHNLRAAKHRFESFQRPLGRCCLYLGALIRTALHVARLRNDKQGTRAHGFLSWLTAERCVAAAMLADAADEAMVLTRFLDSEEADPAEMNLEVAAFVKRIHALFNEGACLRVTGYTSVMLQFLGNPVVYTLGHNVHSLGQAGGVSRDVIDACLARMRRWVLLARATVAAEFPHFEISQAGPACYV